MRPRRPSHDFWPSIESRLPGLVWPALPDQQGLMLATLLAQLDQSQWLAPADIERAQRAQLETLIEHATRHSSFHRDRLEPLRTKGQSSLQERLATIPVMYRGDLQTRSAAIECAWYPPEHGPAEVQRSTGSTGEPVAVRRTVLNDLIWRAMTLREHLWQGRDFRSSLAVLRANFPAGDSARAGISSPDWGSPVNQLFASGPLHALNLQTDVGRQSKWLREIKPAYLLTYPSNLEALLDIAAAEGPAAAGLDRLKGLRSIGETLGDALRQRCRAQLGIEVADVYSTQEVGVIAAECPDADGYHLMSESLVVEILDDAGAPCALGERGRVVVTDLHSFACPLIRYDLGDLAEAAGPCPCGRGLPKIRRVLGRQRNLLRLPDGRRFWPMVGAYAYREIAPVRQYQVVQRSLDRISLRLAVERPLSDAEESALAAKLIEFVGYAFAIDFEYFSGSIPRGPGGKFEDFICAIEG